MSAITEAERCRNTLALYSLTVSNNGVRAGAQTQTQTHREPSREAARVIFTLRSGIKAARCELLYFFPLFKINRNLRWKKPPIMWNCEISICCWLLVTLGELLGFHNNLKCSDRRRRETSARIWDLHHQLQNCTSPLDWSPGRARLCPLSGLHHCTAVTVALLVSEYRQICRRRLVNITQTFWSLQTHLSHFIILNCAPWIIDSPWRSYVRDIWWF